MKEEPESEPPQDNTPEKIMSRTPLQPGSNTCEQELMSNTSDGNLCLIEEIGDIFSAPSNSILIHACNCQGSWGAGIAEAFKKYYPEAFTKYAAHCKKWRSEDLIGALQYSQVHRVIVQADGNLV